MCGLFWHFDAVDDDKSGEVSITFLRCTVWTKLHLKISNLTSNFLNFPRPSRGDVFGGSAKAKGGTEKH
jgi:hypothetical protein